MSDIVEYIHSRWPEVSKREVRRVVREEFKRQRASVYIRTEEQIVFDTLVRVTQIYEKSKPRGGPRGGRGVRA